MSPRMEPLDHIRINSSTEKGKDYFAWAKVKARQLSALNEDIGVEQFQKTIDLGDGLVAHFRKSMAGTEKMHNINVLTKEEAAAMGLVDIKPPEIPVPIEAVAMQALEEEFPTVEREEYDQPEPFAVAEFYVAIEFVTENWVQFDPDDALTNWSTTEIGGITRWPNENLTSCTAFWKLEGGREIDILNTSPAYILAGVGCRDPRTGEAVAGGGTLSPNSAAPKVSGGRLCKITGYEHLQKIEYVAGGGNTYPDLIRSETDQAGVEYSMPAGTYPPTWWAPETAPDRFTRDAVPYSASGGVHNLPLDEDHSLPKLRLAGASDGILYPLGHKAHLSLSLYNGGRIIGEHNGIFLETTLDVNPGDSLPSASDWPTYDEWDPSDGSATEAPSGSLWSFSEWFNDYKYPPDGANRYPDGGLFGSWDPCVYINPTTLNINSYNAYPSLIPGTTGGEVAAGGSTSGAYSAYPVIYGDHNGYPSLLPNRIATLHSSYGIDGDNLSSVVCYNGMSVSGDSTFDGAAEIELSEGYGLPGKDAHLVTGYHVGQSYFYFTIPGQPDPSTDQWIPRCSQVPIPIGVKASMFGYAIFNEGEEQGSSLIYMNAGRSAFRKNILGAPFFYRRGSAISDYRTVPYFSYWDPRWPLWLETPHPGTCLYGFTDWEQGDSQLPTGTNWQFYVQWGIAYGVVSGYSLDGESLEQAGFGSDWPTGKTDPYGIRPHRQLYQDIQAVNWSGSICIQTGEALETISGYVPMTVSRDGLTDNDNKPLLYVKIVEEEGE